MTALRIGVIAGVVWAGIAAWLTSRYSGITWWEVLPLSGAIALQLPPFLSARSLKPTAPPARAWIGWWALVFFVADAAQVVIAQLLGSNLLFILLVSPIEDGCILWAYSYWQQRPVMRLTFRMAIPLLAIASIGLAFYAGEVGGFQAVSGPFRLLLITVAIAYTLVSRATQETGALWQRDWMWVSLGAILYYAAFVVVPPISKALMTQSVRLAQLVYVVKAVVDMAAFLMIWKGMQCPVETSSPSTLPQSSRSSSS